MTQSLRVHWPIFKQVWFVDDSAGGGGIAQLYDRYKKLSKEGEKYGYLVNRPKNWLIV